MTETWPAKMADAMATFENGRPVPRATDMSAQARQPNGGTPQLVPVDHDPFAGQPQGQPQQAEQKDPRASTKLYVGSDNFNDRFTGEPAPKREAPGVAESMARGALQGASFGFDDELRGASAAALAGLPEPIKQVINTLPGNLPAKTVAGIARLLYESYQGEPGDATKAYDRTVADERQRLADGREAHPIASTAGEVAGAIAVPVGGMLNAATMPARIGRGAAVGAGAGALYGAGQGEGLADRASGAAIGGVAGGLIGGAAVPVIEGGFAVARALASKPVDVVRAAINPDGAAQRAVGRAYQKSVTTDPAGVNRILPQELSPTGAGAIPAEANSLRAGMRGTKSKYPIDEITRKAIDHYNRALPSAADQFYKWAGKNYDHEVLSRKAAEDIYGDISNFPKDLAHIFNTGADEAVMITRKDNLEFLPAKTAPSRDDFMRDVVRDEGGIFPVSSLNEAYENLGKGVADGYPAAINAAQRIAKEMGWNVSPGSRYFDISKEGVSKHVRVSDHGNLTKSNPNARTPDINLAPGAHDYNDYINILKKYGLAGASVSPLAALMYGANQGDMQQ